MSVALVTDVGWASPTAPKTASDGGRCPPYAAELAQIPRTDYSDDCSPATQRRYHMQHRSPLVAWLLLATTISVDLVVFGVNGLVDSGDHLKAFAYALVFGQLSVLCIWFAFSTNRNLLRWIVAGIVFAVAVLATYSVERRQDLVFSFILNAIHTTALAMMLLTHRIIAALRRRTSTAVQFSIRDLFVLTTVIAVLAAMSSSAKVLQQAFAVFFILNNVMMAVTALVLWNQSWHWILRVAAALAIGILAGWCLSLFRPHLSGDLEVLNCVQVLVILTWLELGGIIAKNEKVEDSDSAAYLGTQQ